MAAICKRRCQPTILAKSRAGNERSRGGSQTLANDGFDTVVLVLCVAMSATTGNEGCRARNCPFAETNQRSVEVGFSSMQDIKEKVACQKG